MTRRERFYVWWALRSPVTLEEMDLAFQHMRRLWSP